MFGLFLCSYDYYQWMDLVCVSDSSEKLKAHWSSLINEYVLVESAQEHEKLKDNEDYHYYIMPVVSI